MSKGDILYVKGMRISESDASASEVDIWDDTKLNEAYDKALRIASAEVAKRVALSTNKEGIKKCYPSKEKPVKYSSNNREEENVKWSAGMPCRAVYSDDGLEYEAFLLEIIDDKDCVVRFLGYDNTEIVPIKSLRKSLGKEERRLQIEWAYHDNREEKLSQGRRSNLEHMDLGSDQNSSIFSAGSSQKNRKKSNKKQKKPKQNNFSLPSIPMPNLEAFKQLGSLDLPIMPPPPVPLPGSRGHGEDQALSAMLLSWYMSGYYTGFYQGLQRNKKSSREE